MSGLPHLQIIHVDQDFFKYNGKKTFNCIVSDSFGSQAAQIVGLPPKFSKKQKLPIIGVIRYKIEKGLSDNLVILEFVVLEDEIERILGNPKRKSIVLDNQPENCLREYLTQPKGQRKLNKALKPEQLEEIKTQALSIRELYPFNTNSNIVLIAKVLEVSDFKEFSKEDSSGQYFTIQLIDKNQDQIMAVVFNDEKLQEEIEVGEIYEFQDFQIKEQKSKHQLLQTKYSIIFKNTTKIHQSDQIIKPIGCTIAQAKLKPIGSIVNIIAFIEVECPIEHQIGKRKNKSRKQILLKDQTGIMLLNLWQKEDDVPTFDNKIIAISNLKLTSYNKLLQLNNTDTTQFNYDEKDLENEPEYGHLIKIKKEFKKQINSNSQQLLQEMLGINKQEETEQRQDYLIDFQNTRQNIQQQMYAATQSHLDSMHYLQRRHYYKWGYY